MSATRPITPAAGSMNRQLHEQLADAIARIEKLIHIGGMAVDGDSMPDAIDDLLDEDVQTLLKVFPGMPDWVQDELDDRRGRGSAFAEWVHQEGKLGFLVNFATPVMRNVHQRGCGSYSWGSYYTNWIYGETMDEAMQLGLAWVQNLRDKEFAKTRTAGHPLTTEF